MIWRMGDPRIVENAQKLPGIFISKTLIPNIMHGNPEARTGRSHRYTIFWLGGRTSKRFIDWNTDILIIKDDQTLEGLFNPDNVRILDDIRPHDQNRHSS